MAPLPRKSSGSPRSPCPLSPRTRSWYACVAASVDRGTWHIMAGLPYPMRVMGFGRAGPRPPTRAVAWPGPSSRSAKM